MSTRGHCSSNFKPSLIYQHISPTYRITTIGIQTCSYFSFPRKKILPLNQLHLPAIVLFLSCPLQQNFSKVLSMLTTSNFPPPIEWISSMFSFLWRHQNYCYQGPHWHQHCPVQWSFSSSFLTWPSAFHRVDFSLPVKHSLHLKSWTPQDTLVFSFSGSFSSFSSSLIFTYWCSCRHITMRTSVPLLHGFRGYCIEQNKSRESLYG